MHCSQVHMHDFKCTSHEPQTAHAVAAAYATIILMNDQWLSGHSVAFELIMKFLMTCPIMAGHNGNHATHEGISKGLGSREIESHLGCMPSVSVTPHRICENTIPQLPTTVPAGLSVPDRVSPKLDGAWPYGVRSPSLPTLAHHRDLRRHFRPADLHLHTLLCVLHLALAPAETPGPGQVLRTPR